MRSIGWPVSCSIVCGCQPDIQICLPQKGFRDGGGRGEAFGDGARPVAPRDAVAPQQRGDLGVGVQGGQPWVHVVDGVAQRWSAAAYRDAVIVQGAQHQVHGDVLMGDDLEKCAASRRPMPGSRRRARGAAPTGTGGWGHLMTARRAAFDPSRLDDEIDEIAVVVHRAFDPATRVVAGAGGSGGGAVALGAVLVG